MVSVAICYQDDLITDACLLFFEICCDRSESAQKHAHADDLAYGLGMDTHTDSIISAKSVVDRITEITNTVRKKSISNPKKLGDQILSTQRVDQFCTKVFARRVSFLIVQRRTSSLDLSITDNESELDDDDDDDDNEKKKENEKKVKKTKNKIPETSYESTEKEVYLTREAFYKRVLDNEESEFIQMFLQYVLLTHIAEFDINEQDDGLKPKA